MIKPLFYLTVASLLLTACNQEKSAVEAPIKQIEALQSTTLNSTALEGALDNWPNVGGDVGKTHFSRLEQINKDNVSRLGLAWELKLGTNRALEATPLVIDGVMVTSGALGRVYAVNAATGEELWRFEPTVDMQINRTSCCDQANRGVSVKDGRVFVGAMDGIVYALDLKTGKVLWQANSIDEDNRGQHISGATEVAGDVVIIGNGGAEYGARGYVTAYDVATGEQRWRFYTVPSDPVKGPQNNPELEQALETWGDKTRWDLGGGGTVWDAIHYDPEFDAVYIGVGNGGPYHILRRSNELGDNLYLSSVVALDPKTGRVKWHYQETPGDSWDYTATQPMVLTSLDVKGEQVPVLLHAPKNGFFYVIDRRNGKVLQANPIVYINWADSVDLETGRPNVLFDQVDYLNEAKIVFPSTAGARNWNPPSFNPETGLYYASVVDMGALLFVTPGAKEYRPRALNLDTELIFNSDLLTTLPGLPAEIQTAVKNSPEFERVKANPAQSELRAIEPLTGKTVWSVKLPSWQDHSGVLTTAGGLLFQGDLLGNFKAYDVQNGEELFSMPTGSSMIAAPMTYRVDGEQYVAIMAAWGGGGWPYLPSTSAAYKYGNEGRILVFKLDGSKIELPDELPAPEVAPAPPEQLPNVTAETVAKGKGLYFQNCPICHASQPRSISPDLRRMNEGTHKVFNQIVLKGLLLPGGMPRWDDLLTEEDANAIHAYLINEQKALRARELEMVKQGKRVDDVDSKVMSSF